jgi:PfaD family protein
VNPTLPTPTLSAAARTWHGDRAALAFGDEAVRAALDALDRPVYFVVEGGRLGVTHTGSEAAPGQPGPALAAALLPTPPHSLGDAAFRAAYGVRLGYAAGAMANAIASVDLVKALGGAGLLASFGAAGVVGPRLEAAIREVQAALPNGPYAFNLIHSPSEEAMERRTVELYLQYGVRVVEASAFLDLTPHIVRYRAAGLYLGADGRIGMANRVIAKISRRETAAKFMHPAPERLLRPLVEAGHITAEQAEWAARVPMADDITVEADSGGHTDNRPLVVVLPAILALRDEVQAEHGFAQPVRVGAAGGISTPASVLAAFMMGAAYVVTGSVNQACIESGASAHTKKLLAEADMADVMMAPAADMFEMGVKVQLLKRGTLFPMRAQRLYDLYRAYDAIEHIPAEERDKLERQVFKRPIDQIWQETVAYFTERDPEQIARANDNPKRRMALIFRWYLGLSSRWSNSGEKGRELDYQIWCGPAMGAFNAWAKGTRLEQPENRRAADVAEQLMNGAAYLYRVAALKMQGVQLSSTLERALPRG